MSILEARITVSPASDSTSDSAFISSKLIDLNILVDLIFLLVFAPASALPIQCPLKSILKRKREVIILSDNDNNSDLDNGEKELLGDSNYRPGNRLLKYRGNRGQFKLARTE
jgi:hypothetical protein